MPTIDQLSQAKQLTVDDELALFSKAGGGTRKATLEQVATIVQRALQGEPDETIYNAGTDAGGFVVNVLPATPGGSVWAQISLSADASGTVILPDPDNRAHGQDVLVTATAAVPALTVNGQDAAVLGAPMALAANGAFLLRYDLLSNTWFLIGSANVPVGALLTFLQAGAGAVVRPLQEKLREAVSVKDFGAKGDGATDDTAAIQAAISFVSVLGGGEVFFPPGNYKVFKANPSNPGGTNPLDRALQVQASNITLRGVMGASRIFADPSAPARFILLGIGKLPIVNGGVELEDIKVEGLEFDGSYTIPLTGNVPDDGNPLIWLHGVKRSTLRDLHLHNSSDYGIGIQNGGHQDLRLENLVIEDVMADGIDVKNNGDMDGGNKMVNITVRRFGRGYSPADPFAGIDVMGPGWELVNIHVSGYGDYGTPNAGVRFKQGEIGDARGEGGNGGSLTNFYIQAAAKTYASAAGVKISAREVTVANGRVLDCAAEGVLVEQEGNKVSAVTVTGCADAFRARVYSYTTNGDRTTFSSCTAKSNTRGFVVETQECLASNCIATGNGTNVQFTSTSLNNRWLGGVIARATSKQVVNGGVGNLVRDSYGFATVAQVESPTIDIATAGDKSVSIPHGLPFTPSRARCQISLLRSSNNVAWSVSRLMVVGTDATNVSCRIAISSASGTAGDTATLALSVDSALIPPIS